MSTKKTVLITGCTPGSIGCALAQEFQKANCHVIATARRPEALSQLRDLGLNAVPLDIDDEESISAIKNTVEKLTGGKLDILVNNAGARYIMPLTDAEPERVRAIFQTNIVSVMTLTNALMPFLLASEGLIVNISSYSDRVPYPFKGVYAMSKAALTAYSRNLSLELAYYNVGVLNVVTSFVASQGQSGTAEPWPKDSLYDSMRGLVQTPGSGKRMTAEEYARSVVAEALRGKGWNVGPWRFFGTRETMRIGTTSTSLWFLEWLGEGWARFLFLRRWNFWVLRDALRLRRKTD